MRARSRRAADERGSATIEAVVVLPALLLFAGLIIAAGRLAIAHQSVELAAAEAARSASLARSAGEAQSIATSAAADALTGRGLRCASTTILIDTAAFSASAGAPGQVSAHVLCVVDLGGVAVPGLPGTVTVQAEGSSPLDRYRAHRR